MRRAMATLALALLCSLVDALKPLRIEVLRCDTCCASFDPLAVFERLARPSAAEVVAVSCGDACAGPSARVLIDGEAALFGADVMRDSERQRKAFDVAGAADAERVWGAANTLVERLELFEGVGAADPPREKPERPSSSAAFYDAAELQGLLQMHETLDLGADDSDAAGEAESVLDIHDLIQSMVEEGDAESGAS